MSVYEKLVQEFGCAIRAIYGDECEKEFNKDETIITDEELIAIAKKVAFYLD